MSIRYAVIDGCPVPRLYYPLFRRIKAISGCTFNSIYRGEDAAKILHRYGHHTQAEIIELHAEGVVGYGPADPVDETSHCLRNDGVVRPDRPRKSKLRRWEVGWDVNDDEIEDCKRAVAELGGHARQPYDSGSEFHHLNIDKLPPRWKLIFHAVFGVWPNGHKHRRKK
jgi:hypothetical protein